MSVVTLTDSNFEQDVLKSDQPVLVDFCAEWCQPCKMIAPHLEKLANDQEGKLKVAKVNVDENPRMMSEFKIRGIPTLILFKDGQPVETLVGFMAEKQILAKVEKLRDEGKSLDEILAANLTAPYDATTEGDTKQSKDRFITEVYDEVKDFPPVVNGERKMPRRAR